MSFFSFTKHRSELVAIFDVGSSSVAGALVTLERGAKPRILFTHREYLPWNERASGDRLTNSMLKALETSMGKVEKSGLVNLRASGQVKGAIERVVCILSAPWILSRTNILSIHKETPFKIDRTTLNEIFFKNNEDLNKELAKGQLKEFSKGHEIIERKVIQIHVNGYEVSNPYGKKATELELALFLSFGPKELVKKIRAIAEKTMRAHSVEFHSFVLASFYTHDQLLSHDSNFLCVDVRGETTELAVIKKGILVETISFPYGTHTLLREMQKTFKDTPPSVAKAFLKLYAEGKLDETISKKLSKIIDTAKETWLSTFYDALSNVSDEIFIPKRAYITAGDGFLTLFAGFLKAGKFDQFTLTAEPFEVASLDPTAFKDVCDQAAHVNADVFINLEAAFTNTFKHADHFHLSE